MGAQDDQGNTDLAELLVVGSLAKGYEEDGKAVIIRAPFVMTDEAKGLPHIWAPGSFLPVPKQNGPWMTEEGYERENYRHSSGTSDGRYTISRNLCIHC